MTVLQRQSGVTFIELIISIIVIGISVSGILVVMNRNTSSSADPMIRHQSIAIAEAYLDEILAKPFVDADADGEASRYLFDDVDDYNSAVVDGPPRDQGDATTPNGNPIAALALYNVDVQVINEALGPAGALIVAADSFRVTVAVTAPNGAVTTLSGYKTNF